MPDQGRLFVGREQELAAHKQAIARPEGQLILVVGGTGVGKTALLEELNAQIGETADWVAVPYQLNENDSSESFLPRLMGDLLNVDGVTSGKFLWNAPGQIGKVKGFLSAVAKLPSLPGLAPAESLSGLIELLLPDDKRPPREKFIVFLRYAAGRLKEGHRLVLIFDPDKYLDKSQEPDWGSLARDIPDGVTVIFAQRPDDVLAESEAVLTSPKTHRIPEEPLGHLPREKSDELIAERWRQKDGWMKLAAVPPAELCQALWDKYHGWPLPLTMVLSDLPQEPDGLDQLLAAAKEMPKALRDLLSLRYGKAAAEGDDAVRLLQGLAILERPATADRVAALYGDECDAPAVTAAAHCPAVTKCLSQGEKGLLSLFHTTMAECVLDQMSEDAKRDLHRRAAGLYGKDLAKNKSDREALDRLPDHAYHAGQAKPFLQAVNRVGAHKHILGLFRSLHRDLERAVTALRELKQKETNRYQWRRDLADNLNRLGIAQRHVGQPRDAVKSCEAALREYGELQCLIGDDLRGQIASVHNTLGTAHVELGDPDSASGAFREAESIFRQLLVSDRTRWAADLSATLTNIADVERQYGKPEDAIQKLTEARDLLKEIKDQVRQARRSEWQLRLGATLNNLGLARLAGEDLAGAEGDLRNAADLFENLREQLGPGALYGLGTAWNGLTDACRKQHKLAEAQSSSENAQKAWRELAKTEPAAESRLAAALYNQGVLRAGTGDHDAARANFNEALSLAIPWAAADPLAHADLLATIVKGARKLMEQTGEKPEEWPALVEAVKLLAQLSPADEDDKQHDS